MNHGIIVNPDLIGQTIEILQCAGRRHSEQVVLWFAHRKSAWLQVVEVYHPKQKASEDYFRISAASMQAIMKRLGESAAMIAAQVHSHPFEAFHSQADDRWAIVRHAGAISIVLPDFARDVAVENFLDQSATYYLDPRNRWRPVPANLLSQVVLIQQ